ncbi:MAG: hypothetical protein Q8P95_01580, partial [bacterium]|nr:hypothetical protein [bacterium]
FFDSPSPLHTSTTSQIIPFDDVRTRLQAELGLADSGGNKIEKIKKIAGTLSEIFGRGNSQHLDEAEISSRATTSVDHYTSIILSRCGDRVCALRELRKLRTQLSNSELKSLRKMLSRHHSLMNTRPSKNS